MGSSGENKECQVGGYVLSGLALARGKGNVEVVDLVLGELKLLGAVLGLVAAGEDHLGAADNVARHVVRQVAVNGGDIEVLADLGDDRRDVGTLVAGPHHAERSLHGLGIATGIMGEG